LLLRETEACAEALLVDLDRACCGAPPAAAARLAEILRLHRSLVKRGLAARVGRRAQAAFLTAYTGADRPLRRALLRRPPPARGGVSRCTGSAGSSRGSSGARPGRGSPPAWAISSSRTSRSARRHGSASTR